MLSIYEQYRKVCFNSRLKEGEISVPEMLSAIELSNKNFLIRQENAIPETPKTEIEKYEQWKQGRKVKCLDDLEGYKIAKVTAAVDMYINQFGEVREIYLSGSYTSGSWIDANCSSNDKKMRSIMKRDKTESDFDLIPVPFHGSTRIDNVDFTEAPKGERVLIYQNGEYVSCI